MTSRSFKVEQERPGDREDPEPGACGGSAPRSFSDPSNKDERYYHRDGSLKWGDPVNVQHLILQLQTLEPEMKVSSVTFIDTSRGREARAYGLSMSRERWDDNGWLNFKLPVPASLAIWASPLEQSEKVAAQPLGTEAPTLANPRRLPGTDEATGTAQDCSTTKEP